MAVSASSIGVTNEVVACNFENFHGIRLLVRNSGARARVAYLGSADVVFGEGFELDAGETVAVELHAGDVLYAVSDAEGTTLNVLRS